MVLLFFRVACRLLRLLSDRYRFPSAASHEKRANTFVVIARWLSTLSTQKMLICIRSKSNLMLIFAILPAERASINHRIVFLASTL